MEKSEFFGRLLKAGVNSIATCEGKTAPAIEYELGEKIGLTGYAIQRYKVGHIPPDYIVLETIAEAAVTRGLMSKEWLMQFLHTGRHPNPEKISSILFPEIINKPRPEKIYHNLPAPIYNKFIARHKPFEDLKLGLQQRVAVVLIVSLGGMGKTSIAREIAEQCLFGDENYPRFDAAVWVSDKSREGTTSLNLLLDKISKTLDYPGITKFSFEEKKVEIDKLLREKRVLIILDNFETITDTSLVQWLLKLPEPSKAIVTSREYSRAFRNCTYVVEMHGMEDAEAKELILSRAKMVGLEKLFSDFSQFGPLLQATGGNPKAIEISLGYIKYQHKPLDEIINELYDARGELFDYLFTRSWQLLTTEDQKVLLSMYLFPFGAYPDALSSVSNIKLYSFDLSLTHLIDLSLVDVYRKDLISKNHYTLHPLVRSFVRSKLVTQHEVENDLRNRWISWYKNLAAKIGFCWNNVKRLEYLDPAGERENLEAVLTWCFAQERYQDVIDISKDVKYYYYVRGVWTTQNNLMRAEAAKLLDDKFVEFEALVYHINIASKQNNIGEVEKYIDRLDELSLLPGLESQSLVDFRHAKALYYLARHDNDQAIELWKTNLSVGELSEHSDNANRRWMAVCLYDSGKIDDAKMIFENIRLDAETQNFDRGIISAETYLASIAIDQNQLNNAEKWLTHASTLALTIQDRRAVAEINQIYSRYYLEIDDKFQSREYIENAIDGFERLGLHNKLLEARKMLALLTA
jgi:hypothetical protein